MSEPQIETARPDSIETVLSRFPIPADYRADLLAALVAREENIADLLRLAGAQFNLFPEIVAEMFAQVGLGEPMSADQRRMVHANYHALMDRLRNEFEQGHGN